MSDFLGKMFRARNWDHHDTDPQTQLWFKFSLGRQKKNARTVAIMLCLGEEPIFQPMDDAELEARMRQLGWVRAAE